jgi:hypothetical protein
VDTPIASREGRDRVTENYIGVPVLASLETALRPFLIDLKICSDRGRRVHAHPHDGDND